jgi:hypothetical protein
MVLVHHQVHGNLVSTEAFVLYARVHENSRVTLHWSSQMHSALVLSFLELFGLTHEIHECQIHDILYPLG